MSTIGKSSAEHFVARDREIQVRRVAAASLVGTTIEWYDFLVYATMAGVIFNRYFFAERSIFVNTLLAYGTFAAGFFMRQGQTASRSTINWILALAIQIRESPANTALQPEDRITSYIDHDLSIPETLRS